MKLWCDEEKRIEIELLKSKYSLDEINGAIFILYGEQLEAQRLTILMIALLNNFMRKGLHLAKHGRKVA